MAVETESTVTKILDTWHCISVPLPTYYDHYNDMLVWALEHAEDKFYIANGKYVYFKQESDATMFALKWGSQ